MLPYSKNSLAAYEKNKHLILVEQISTNHTNKNVKSFQKSQICISKNLVQHKKDKKHFIESYKKNKHTNGRMTNF